MRNVNKIRRLSDGCLASARRPMPADEQAPTCRVPWLSSRVPWLRLLQPRFCATTPPSIVVANTATTAPDHAIRNPAKKSKIRNPQSKIRNAFTLTELLVVIAIIVLVAAVALPTVIGLFSAGADAQAHNIIAAQLAYARALAIQNNTYAGVHVQMADNPDFEETCYAAVVLYKNVDPGTGVDMKFDLADGSKPQRIPGSIAFGQLRGTGTLTSFVTSGGSYENLTNGDLPDFTSFTIVFSPSGQVVTSVEGNTIFFNNDEGTSYNTNSLFTDQSTVSGPYLWRFQNTNSEPAATAITMFDYRELVGRTSASDREDYLDESGQFLPINVYTGQLFPRE